MKHSVCASALCKLRKSRTKIHRKRNSRLGESVEVFKDTLPFGQNSLPSLSKPHLVSSFSCQLFEQEDSRVSASRQTRVCVHVAVLPLASRRECLSHPLHVLLVSLVRPRAPFPHLKC